MKRAIVFILSVCYVSSFIAQKDSSSKMRFSGFQLEIGTNLYPEYVEQTQADYKKIVKNDPLLNADLSTYEKQNWHLQYNNFSGLAGIKFYAQLSDMKRLKKEVYFGLKYGEEGNTGINYGKKTYDTTGVFLDLNTNTKVYEVNYRVATYNFGISSRKLMLPLGFNFTTNKEKAFWIAMGFEITPALNFNYVFTSYYQTNDSKQVLREGESLNAESNTTHTSFDRTIRAKQTKTKLNGLGFCAYASLPFTMYLHPFKNVTGLKHIHLLGSIVPIYMYSDDRYYHSVSYLSVSFSTGLRVIW